MKKILLLFLLGMCADLSAEEIIYPAEYKPAHDNITQFRNWYNRTIDGSLSVGPTVPEDTFSGGETRSVTVNYKIKGLLHFITSSQSFELVREKIRQDKEQFRKNNWEKPDHFLFHEVYGNIVIEYPEGVSYKDSPLSTTYGRYINNHDFEMMKSLFNGGVSPNTFIHIKGNIPGINPLVAIGRREKTVHGDYSDLEFLLAHGAEINFRMDSEGVGDTVLAQAVNNANPGYAIALVREMGADPNYQPTVLNSAAWWGYYEVCSALLEHGADINYQLNKGGLFRTPLHQATMRKHNRVFDLLLKNGARTDILDINNESIFSYALHADNKYVLDKYRNKSIWFTPEILEKECPLYRTVKYDNIEFAKLLLDRGIEDDMDHLLYVAAATTESIEMLQLLIDYGADPTSETRGKLPIEYASQRGKRKLVEFLSSYIDTNSDTQQESWGIIIKNRLAFRAVKEQPNVDVPSKTVAYAKRNARVRIIGEKDYHSRRMQRTYRFYQVQLKSGKTGWMRADSLFKEPETISTNYRGAKLKMLDKPDRIFLWAYPSDKIPNVPVVARMGQTSRVTLLARTKEKLTIQGESTYWYRITSQKGKTGWVSGFYIEELPPPRENPEGLL